MEGRLVCGLFLRRRAVLLTLGSSPVAQWTTMQRLVLLLDPVASGLWPNLGCHRKGLEFLPLCARWLIGRANPSVPESMTEADAL